MIYKKQVCKGNSACISVSFPPKKIFPPRDKKPKTHMRLKEATKRQLCNGSVLGIFDHVP